MRPEAASKKLLAITRSQSKMYEYSIPREHHIVIPEHPEELFPLAIGLLGDASAATENALSPDMLREDSEALRFAAQFFDSYSQAKFSPTLEQYLLLVGAAAFYLCSLPGSSRLLASKLIANVSNDDADGMRAALIWLVKEDLMNPPNLQNLRFSGALNLVCASVVEHFQSGSDGRVLFNQLGLLRSAVYRRGTPRELLFADAICAVAKRRYWNSTRYCLPRYSDIPMAQWETVFSKSTFIKEFWPAQHLLGEVGVFRGQSAVIQMPTSAGKTRSVEIAIRSSFLSGRTALAVVIAPFKALCHEIRDGLSEAFRDDGIIVDELSDAIQMDVDVNKLLIQKQVVVVTPEKLVYIIRHAPEVAAKIGLVVYDEGHQFDTGKRGVTYELLVSSLKRMLPETVQVLLISAVISNADAINLWLNGDRGRVASGADLLPTQRAIGFASWKTSRGRIEFIDEQNPNEQAYFVPRVIEAATLKKLPREKKVRVFPERKDGNSIALDLGLNLVRNGGVAIFCGQKLTAAGICDDAVELFKRDPPRKKPSEVSDQGEIERLVYLYSRNFGATAPATRSAELGIFAHHANTPHGLRLAVEHGMKLGLIRFVVCTSTLAQGVNLPIRYLIVTSLQQGADRIKVRDFHNLIGRAGRSGMHTEGSILFADSQIRDGRQNFNDRWRWREVVRLLEPKNSEPCASSLLDFFLPLESDDRRLELAFDGIFLIEECIANGNDAASFVNGLLAGIPQPPFSRSGLERQVRQKLDTISAVESYLMAYCEDPTPNSQEIMGLVTGTLAYHLASETERPLLISLFNIVAAHVAATVKFDDQRKLYSKMLLGARQAYQIDLWVNQHLDEIAACGTVEQILEMCWPVIFSNTANSTINKCSKPPIIRKLCDGWISNRPYSELLEILKGSGARIGGGKGARHPTAEHVVEICEKGLGFDSALIVAAIATCFERQRPYRVAGGLLAELQKRMKYGLESSTQILLYELGFADRAVCADFAEVVADVNSRPEMIVAIRDRAQRLTEIAAQYPSYYQGRLATLI